MKNYGERECRFDGCSNFAQIAGTHLCSTHNRQRLRGEPLHAVASRSKSDIGVEGWRRCTKCDEIKKVDEFYQIAPGKYRSHCKACHIKQVMERTAERAQEAQNGV